MKTIVNHLRPVSTASTDSALKNSTDNNPSEPLSVLLLEKFFRAMQIEFGNRWSSQFPTPHSLADAKIEWGAKLAGLTAEQIRAGLNAMDVSPGAWPLGPRGFVQLAKDVTRRPPSTVEKNETKALRHGTWGDTAAVVAEHVQTARTAIAPRQATRSLRDIAAGLWTREMEANFCHHAAHLGRKVKPTAWPDEGDR